MLRVVYYTKVAKNRVFVYTHIAFGFGCRVRAGRRGRRRDRIVGRFARLRIDAEYLVAAEQTLVGRQRLADWRTLVDFSAGGRARCLGQTRGEAAGVAPVARGVGLACVTRLVIATNSLSRCDKRHGNYTRNCRVF
jgi:hypothetical protein